MKARGNTTRSGREPHDRDSKRQAAEWLARRQAQGFDDADQAAFDAWLSADPRHPAAFAETEAAWTVFDRLKAYPRESDAQADPDLLSRERRAALPVGFVRSGLLVAAAAAVLAVVWLRPWSGKDLPPERQIAARSEPRPMAAGQETRFLHLPDSSEVELNAGAQVLELFSPGERRIRLVGGEAYFVVAKDPSRPFVVEAGSVSARALGTAFNVRMDSAKVEILVTEGRVEVARRVSHAPGDIGNAVDSGPVVLGANQRATIADASGRETVGASAVETLPASALNESLSWQSARLVFDSVPLEEVVRRFDRHTQGRPGAPRIVLGDATVGGLLVSGRIRPDNLESFIEVLESSFGVRIERCGDGEIVLRAP